MDTLSPQSGSLHLDPSWPLSLGSADGIAEPGLAGQPKTHGSLDVVRVLSGVYSIECRALGLALVLKALVLGSFGVHDHTGTMQLKVFRAILSSI